MYLAHPRLSPAVLPTHLLSQPEVCSLPGPDGLTNDILQRGERSPQVWSAVLGCLIHLVSHCGYVVRAYLEGLSIKVVLALMQCSLDNQWCDTVYCQLVRLAANMLYIPTVHAQGKPCSAACSPCPVQSCLRKEICKSFTRCIMICEHACIFACLELRFDICKSKHCCSIVRK